MCSGVCALLPVIRDISGRINIIIWRISSAICRFAMAAENTPPEAVSSMMRETSEAVVSSATRWI